MSTLTDILHALADQAVGDRAGELHSQITLLEEVPETEGEAENADE